MLGIMEVLPGTVEKLQEWRDKGYIIILTTARPEYGRYRTMEQLHKCGIIYDKLIMDLGSGKRVLINDVKPHMSITAESHNLIRDTGIKNLQIAD